MKLSTVDDKITAHVVERFLHANEERERVPEDVGEEDEGLESRRPERVPVYNKVKEWYTKVLPETLHNNPEHYEGREPENEVYEPEEESREGDEGLESWQSERFFQAKEDRVPVRNKKKEWDTRVLPETLKKHPERYDTRDLQDERNLPPKPKHGQPERAREPEKPRTPRKPERPHWDRVPPPLPPKYPKPIKPPRPVRLVEPVKPVLPAPIPKPEDARPAPLLPGEERGERPDWAQAKEKKHLQGHVSMNEERYFMKPETNESYNYARTLRKASDASSWRIATNTDPYAQEQEEVSVYKQIETLLDQDLKKFKKGHAWWDQEHNFAINTALSNINCWYFTILPLFPARSAYRPADPKTGSPEGIVIHPAWAVFKDGDRAYDLEEVKDLIKKAKSQPTLEETVKKELNWVESTFQIKIPSNVEAALLKDVKKVAERRWGVDHLRIKNVLVPLDGGKSVELSNW